jgi:hypothetical protein
MSRRKFMPTSDTCLGLHTVERFWRSLLSGPRSPALKVATIMYVCALLFYAAQNGSLPTVRDNPSVFQGSCTHSSTAWSLVMGWLGWTETSVRNYHSALRRVPKERSSNSHRGGNLKSRTFHEPPTKNPVPLNSGNQWAAIIACGVRRMTFLKGEHHLSLLYQLCGNRIFEHIRANGSRCDGLKKKRKRRHLGVTTLQSVTRRIFFFLIFVTSTKG